MSFRVIRYTFPNGARIYSDKGTGVNRARFSPAWMPLNQSMPMTRQNAADALRDARRQGLRLSVAQWVAG